MTSTFVNEKRVAVQAFVRELTGRRVGPNAPDDMIVPYLLELNAIPGAYSWSSCAGHKGEVRNGRWLHRDAAGERSIGYVWVVLRYEPRRVPKSLGFREDTFGRVAVFHPFQENTRKISFEFEGGSRLEADMGIVLAYLWELPIG